LTEPASHAGFRDLARQALSRRTGIPAKTDWEVFLHGFASTNQLGGEKERDIYECLLRTFPTPESVLEQDLNTLRNEEGCQNLISPVSAAGWMKQNAENWDNIAPLLRCRTRAEQEAIRNFTDDPQNQNKRLKNQVMGAGYKGSDMTLLWGGCEVPVVDKQLVRYLAPHMLGRDWDSYIREKLSERKGQGRRLRIGRRFAAELGEDIEAVDIDVDNPNHRYAEEEDIVSKIQSTVGRYGAWRDLAYQMADAEGIPANIWHVATWLEYRIGGDPDSPRANPRTLARGREFADRTYNLSTTPSAEQETPDAYLWQDIREYAEENPDTSVRDVAEEFEVDSSIVSRALGREPAIVLPHLVRLRYDDIREVAASNPGMNKTEIANEFEVDIRTVNKALDLWPRIIILPYGSGRGLGRTPIATPPKPLDELTKEIRNYALKRPGVHQDVLAKELGMTRARVQFALAREPRILTKVTSETPSAEQEEPIREERDRLLAEYASKADQLRAQWQRELGREIGYMDQDMWDIIMPQDSIYQWVLPRPRGGYPHTPLLREGPKSIYYIPGWVKIRAYGTKNPHLTVTEIAKELGYSVSHASRSLIGHDHRGEYFGPRIQVGETQRLRRAEVIQTYMQHPDLTIIELAEMYGVSKESVVTWVRESGKERRGTGFKSRKPSAFVGFEGPFGFDDDITKQSKDWIQYKIGTTPVVVRRTGTKPGTKLNPQYKGAGQPQELLIEFRLRASTRQDMEKINFLLERLREDNPTMTVNVNVKTNGKTAHRRLPTWEDRPYRLEPAAWYGFETPEEYEDRVTSWRWRHIEEEKGIADDGTTLETVRSGPDVLVEETEEEDHHLIVEGLDDEERQAYYAGYFSAPDSSDVVWNINGVRVGLRYGSVSLGHYSGGAFPTEVVNNAAEIQWHRVGGEIDRETFNKVNALLDRIHQENPGIRIFAHAVGEVIMKDPVTGEDRAVQPGVKGELSAPRGRKDIRARVYARHGWQKLYDMESSRTEGDAMMEWLPPDQRTPRTPNAFDGIDRYAGAIMELV